jgi:hypothetical protein
VLVGTSVTWKNDDSINHTVTADGDAFSSGYVPPGGTYTFTFAKQGHYAFHCTIHKFMRGEVDVFGLVLSGPEGPVASGQRVVFAGLAPPGTQSVTLRGAPTGDRVGKRPAGRQLRRRSRHRRSGQLPGGRGAPREPRRARAGAPTGPRCADG